MPALSPQTFTVLQEVRLRGSRGIPSQEAMGQNLLGTDVGNFESTADGFNAGGSGSTVSQSTEQAFLGTGSLKVVYPGPSSGEKVAWPSSIPVQPGRTITVSARVYSTVADNITLNFEERDASDVWLRNNGANVAHGGTGWEWLTWTVTLSPDAFFIWPWSDRWPDTDARTFYFDTAKIEYGSVATPWRRGDVSVAAGSDQTVTGTAGIASAEAFGSTGDQVDLTLIGAAGIASAQAFGAAGGALITFPNFGKTAVSATLNSKGADFKVGSKFTLTEAALVDAVYPYIDIVAGTGGAPSRAMIYRVSDGALMGTTAEQTISGASPSNWFRHPFATPLALPAGDYWLMWHTGAYTGTATFNWIGDAAASGNFFANNDTYSDGPSDPIGANTTGNSARQMSIYATYSLVAIGNTGIPSGQTFGGNGQIDLDVTGSAGIASAQAFGTGGQVNLELVGSAGIASAGAYGADGTVTQPGVPQTIVGSSGIASAEAFGSTGDQLDLTILGAAGIASAQSFGAGGALGLTVSGAAGIPSGVAFGAGGSITAPIVGFAGIPSAQAFGVDGLVVIPQTVTGTAGIPSAQTFGVGTVFRWLGFPPTDPGGLSLTPTAPGALGMTSTVPGALALTPTAPGGLAITPTVPGGLTLDPN